MLSRIIIFMTLITNSLFLVKIIDGSPENTSDIKYLPIFHTTDLHGFFYPQEVKLSQNTYTRGGLEYMAKYMTILKEKFGSNYMWIDSGDQFQGSIENKISNGKIMTDFLNTMECAASGVGNHEWDFGQDFLEEKLNIAKTYNYYAANVEISADKKEKFKNLKSVKKMQIGDYNIGIVGLTATKTPETTSGDLEGITFKDNVETIKGIIDDLRKDTHAVLLIAHFGIQCPENKDKDELKIRKKSTIQNECNKSDELYDLLDALPRGTVDAVLAGHKHENIHYWINDTPVIGDKNNGVHASILYLAFDNNKKLLKNEIVMESPLPICEKIFEKTKNCNSFKDNQIPDETGNLVQFKYRGTIIDKESKLQSIADEWFDKLKEYKSVIIGKTDGELKKEIGSESNLNNFIANIHLSVTGADVAIVSHGSFRVAWSTGNISRADLYEMNPFDGNFVTVKVTGEELFRMIRELQNGTYKYYFTAGIKQVFKGQGNLISLKLYNGLTEKKIDPKEMYTLATIDYDIPFGGDDFSSILKWYTPRNLIVITREIKDHIEKYLLSISEIKASELIDPLNPRIRTIT